MILIDNNTNSMMMAFYRGISKTIQTILLFSICSTFGFAQDNHSSVNNKSRPFRFIFSISLFHSIKTEDAVASTKILIDKIKKDKNLKEDIEIIVCETVEELVAESKKEFDCIIAASVETSALRKGGNVKPVLVNLTQGSYGYVYYLISNKNQNFQNISDLKNGDLKILARSPGQVPSVWLDKILRDNHLPAKEKFFSSIEYDYKTTNVVLPVFFNKVSSAIVSKSTFELMCELNPQVEKQTRILEISEPLLFGIVFFDTKSKDKEREKFVYDTMIDLDKDIYGKQLLDLLSIEKVIPYKEEYWKNFLKLYK